MKIKYYKEDDILVLKFSSKPVDDSFEVESGAVLEVSKDSKPVSLEILHASKFLKKELPLDFKRQILAS